MLEDTRTVRSTRRLGRSAIGASWTLGSGEDVGGTPGTLGRPSISSIRPSFSRLRGVLLGGYRLVGAVILV